MGKLPCRGTREYCQCAYDAIAHPRNVSKVVLDSVVPYHLDPAFALDLVGERAQARVLRDACDAAPACGYDPAGMLPRVPILFVNGTHDLSTPLEWARQDLRRAPLGTLVTVPGAAHSIQTGEDGTVGRAAITSFLDN